MCGSVARVLIRVWKLRTQYKFYPNYCIISRRENPFFFEEEHIPGDAAGGVGKISSGERPLVGNQGLSQKRLPLASNR